MFLGVAYAKVFINSDFENILAVWRPTPSDRVDLASNRMPVPYRSSHSDEPSELAWRTVGFAPHVTGPGDGKGNGCGEPGPVTRRRAQVRTPPR